MNEGRYGQVYSDAADGFLWAVGADKLMFHLDTVILLLKRQLSF